MDRAHNPFGGGDHHPTDSTQGAGSPEVLRQYRSHAEWVASLRSGSARIDAERLSQQQLPPLSQVAADAIMDPSPSTAASESLAAHSSMPDSRYLPGTFPYRQDHLPVQPSMGEAYAQMQPQPSYHEVPRHPYPNPYSERQFVPQHTSRHETQLTWVPPEHPETLPMQDGASRSRRRLDTSSDRAREILPQQRQLAQELSLIGERYLNKFDVQGTLSLRITPNGEELTDAEKNVAGIHLRYGLNSAFEVYIPSNIILANNYNHQVLTMNTLNQYAPNSVADVRTMSRFFYDVAYNTRNRETIGLWIVIPERPGPQR